jgi:toxin FitB
LKFLLDTVVLSETRKARMSQHVSTWFASVTSDDLHVSVISIAEVHLGIELVRPKDPQFARGLSHWIEEILRLRAERIVGIDVPVARRWGELSGRMGHRGFDLAIAATALEHNLVVATRNTSDFLPAGVPVLNPFEPNPTVVRPAL